MRSPGAIVIGGYVNGLGLARALAARGIAVAVIRTKPYDIAHLSRFVTSHAAILEIEERPELLVDLLERRAPEWGGSALFPTNDGALAALARYRDRLSAAYRVVAPDWEVARYFLDKTLMLGVARAAGVDVPRCYGPAVEATAALPELDFPLVVKPVEGHRFFSRFGSKLFVVENREELRRSIARLADGRTPCEVFDLIPGPENHFYAYCTYLDRNGEPVVGLTVRKLRLSPPFFGVSRVAEIVEDNPALREATIEIVRRIGFRGMAAGEFKLDPRDGSFRFLEVNGRSVLYNALLRKGGLDLGGLAWSDYVCGRPESARPSVWCGVWIELHADLLYSTLYGRQNRLSLADFLAPYRRPKVHAVWDPMDPRPFLAQWSMTAARAVSALWHGRHRQLLADPTRVRT